MMGLWCSYPFYCLQDLWDGMHSCFKVNLPFKSVSAYANRHGVSPEMKSDPVSSCTDASYRRDRFSVSSAMIV